MKRKAHIEVIVSQVASQDFPIWLECKLKEFDGKEHLIVEKAPVLTSKEISTKDIPSPLKIECNFIGNEGDQVTIDLLHGIESTEGVSRFTVHRSSYHAS
jgi:hypothetical protein